MIDLSFNMINNDCEFVIDDEDMINSCIRRLNTEIDSTLYPVYGSNFQGILGLKRTSVNLEFLNQSISGYLLQDKRISSCSVISEYKDNGIISKINIVYNDNELDFNFELNNY